MLTQYRQIKARFPDALVLFRLGDFYETFEANAKTTARELELVLTSRSFAKGVRLPVAGVPHHHVQAYIAELIDKGYKVALFEQLEDPKKVKRLAKRDVIRVITPGTVVEDALLRAKSDNYLAAIVRAPPLPSPVRKNHKQGRVLGLQSPTSPRANLRRRRSKARMMMLRKIARQVATHLSKPNRFAAIAGQRRRICRARESDSPRAHLAD